MLVALHGPAAYAKMHLRSPTPGDEPAVSHSFQLTAMSTHSHCEPQPILWAQPTIFAARLSLRSFGRLLVSELG